MAKLSFGGGAITRPSEVNSGSHHRQGKPNIVLGREASGEAAMCDRRAGAVQVWKGLGPREMRGCREAPGLCRRHHWPFPSRQTSLRGHGETRSFSWQALEWLKEALSGWQYGVTRGRAGVSVVQRRLFLVAHVEVCSRAVETRALDSFRAPRIRCAPLLPVPSGCAGDDALAGRWGCSCRALWTLLPTLGPALWGSSRSCSVERCLMRQPVGLWHLTCLT